MKNKLKKFFIILISFILIFSVGITSVYGYDWNFEQFDEENTGVDVGKAGEMINDSGATIIAIFQVIAMGIAVMMLVVTGIMYIFSSTSDKKAELKKHMPNYIVAVVLTFAAGTILGIVRDFIDGNINPDNTVNTVNTVK